MITCKESARLISESQDTPLPRGKRIALRVHLCMCRMCRNYLRQLKFLRQVVIEPLGDVDAEHLPSDQHLSPDKKERIQSAVMAEVQQEKDKPEE